jgi:hypothetical protein
MTFKNANKSAKEYPGEFRVIMADDVVYTKIMQAFSWYESGDLVNPDTGNKWKDDDDKVVRRFTVAYTFKCLRGLGPQTLLELVEKITLGLNEGGELIEGTTLCPKIYLGSHRPKNKSISSLKEWTDRKKSKNAIVRWLNRQCVENVWYEDDVDVDQWRLFKERRGFNSAIMDELIRTASKPFLAKFMKASDSPRRQQDPPSEKFLAALSRIVKKDRGTRTDIQLALGFIRPNGHLTRFRRYRYEYTRNAKKSDLENRKSWAFVDTQELTFAAGIIDFRSLEVFVDREEYVCDPDHGRSYLGVLKTFVEPINYLQASSYWLAVAHTNKEDEARTALIHHLKGWSVKTARYVPAAAESHFFLSSTLKRGNGVTILLFTKPEASALKWKDTVRSEERFKRVGQVKEYGYLDHELRMEVYLDFFRQVPRQETDEVPDVLCIAAGRKCLIAA